MDNKNIFDKKKAPLKKSAYYIIMGVCVAVIGAASFISYKSIQNAIADTKIENTPEIIDKVDTTLDNVPTEPEPDPEPEPQAPSEPADTKPQPQPVIESKAYIMPISSGEVTLGFSITKPVYSKTLNDWRVHDGIDISATLGQNVVAVNDGAVEKIINDDIFGFTVVIKHTDGKKSTYCNLEDSIELEEGQLINQGDIVGKVGNTAIFEISEPPHLHFEMSANGKKIDPMSVIKSE